LSVPVERFGPLGEVDADALDDSTSRESDAA